MDLMPRIALVLGLFVLTYMLNIPFGHFRTRVRKLSFKWFLYIHLPIPFIFLGRTLSHLDYRYIPFFVAAAVLGQISGGKLVF